MRERRARVDRQPFAARLDKAMRAAVDPRVRLLGFCSIGPLLRQKPTESTAGAISPLTGGQVRPPRLAAAGDATGAQAGPAYQASGAPNPTPKLITAWLSQAGQRSDSVPARTHMSRYTGTERTYMNPGLRWHTALEDPTRAVHRFGR